MKTMILGIFKSVLEAENAIMDLERHGYDPKDLSIIMQDDENAKKMLKDTGAKVSGGTVGGVTTGGVVGGLTGLLIGLGVLTIPGLGPILLGGPLIASLGLTGAAATTVSGALTGAVAGGLVGALAGLGLSEEEAQFYESSIKEGAVFIAVPLNENEENDIQDIMKRHGVDRLKSVNVTLK